MANPFYGRDATWLRAEIQKAQADLSAGKTRISGGAGELNFGAQVHLNPRTRLDLLFRALRAVDPSAAPPEETATDSFTTVQVG